MIRYLLLTLALITFNGPAIAAQTIELIQVPCQFLDVEADQGFKPVTKPTATPSTPAQPSSDCKKQKSCN